MSPKGLLVLSCIFLAGFLLLGLGKCGYDRISVFQSIEAVESDVRKKFPVVESISPETLILNLDAGRKVVLIDVRTEEEYEVSHLTGAVLLSKLGEVISYLEQLDTEPDFVVLYGAVGYRSAKLAEALKANGVAGVQHLSGSIFRWAAEGRPLVDSTGKSSTRVHPHQRHLAGLLPENARAPLTSDH
ncbi:MAG: rhodanese-like domain-containing protein [Verrucomicrobiota bacterium]